MDTQITVQDKTRDLFQAPDVFNQFEAILRGGTNAYIQSALLCIADKPKLQECTPDSLVLSALRSATLGLSLDPSIRQAYMIPRPLKGIWTACFQPHYHGLYDLAVRTNKYRYISVAPIYEGETVLENVQTGIHFYTRGGGKTLLAPNPGENGLHIGYRDVTAGKDTAKVIGYLGHFKTIAGFEKSVWMTIPEIHAHAQKWAPENYKSQYGAWQDKKKVAVREMKTVFIALSKFMDLSGNESWKFKEAIEDAVEVEEPDNAPADLIPEPLEVVYHDIGQREPVTESAQELVIESTLPGPQKSKVMANEIITDSDWNNFSRLVQQAANAGIAVLDYNRTKMTASTVNGASEYLRGAMEKHKAKA